MADSSDIPGIAPALPHLSLAADGHHSLLGMRCAACGNVVEGQRLACPACGARQALEAMTLGTSGSVHTATLIYRSYPGVPVPFYAAVIDLDGGGSIRGTLRDVAPGEVMPTGLRVAMVFGESGQRDGEGRALIAYHFVPATGETA